MTGCGLAQAALRIDASNADALVGRAEVAVFLGRAAAARGDAAGAAGLMRAAVEAYGAALRDPAKVGDFEGKGRVWVGGTARGDATAWRSAVWLPGSANSSKNNTATCR